MATEEENAPAGVAIQTSNDLQNSTEPEGRKRKASPGQDSDDDSAKRAKHEGDGRPTPSKSPDQRRDRSGEKERRASVAMQEEKKRGKRLFGGLLTTLSQKPNNSQQQKRRQEIERRQLDKMQQQSAEDDKKRSEKRAALHEIRMEQQISWEEQVMRNSHAKQLRLAQFLRTRSKPEIYYLPWRLTQQEEDIIEGQVCDCKASITRELEDFRSRKEQHLKRYGPNRDSKETCVGSPLAPEPARQDEPAPDKPQEPAAPSPRQEHAEEKAVDAHDDPHDDSGDVLVEGDEDMVIY